MDEKALTLKEAAELLGYSYGTIFQKRYELGFRLPDSREWRIWPSRLAELTRPKNNVIRLSTRVTGETDLCRSQNGPIRASGGLMSHRRVAKELDALLGQATAKKRKSSTTS